jgi:hypothetical protein
VNWDQVSQGVNVLLPQVVGVISDLTRKRKESLAGLINEKARLQKKLSKATTTWDRDKYSEQIAAVERQIIALETAISSDAPPSALDEQLQKSKPQAGALPWVIGGLAVVGLGGLLVWKLTQKDT